MVLAYMLVCIRIATGSGIGKKVKVCVYADYVHVDVYAHMCKYLCLCICKHIGIQVYMCACMYMSIYVNVLENNVQMYVWDILIEGPSF